MHTHDIDSIKIDEDGKFVYMKCTCGLIKGEPVTPEEASELQALIRY